VGRWLKVQLFKLVLIAGFVVAVGSYWLYQNALEQVDAVLARPLWEEQGQITADVNVVAGLGVGPQVVSAALQGAGYSHVESPKDDGDYSVEGSAIFVRDRGVDVLMTFNGDTISSVSPNPFHRFRATELAGVGGGNERRQPIQRDEMPEHLILAVLAMEDSRFFEHPGVDAWGVLRALIVNVIGSGHKQGGSTLTQQLAKNLFLTPDRTLKRKVRELALAVALEDRLTKDQILELYLNQVYLGSSGGIGICGVDQAAATFFGTSARRLSLGQAATLGGIISAPNRYSPARHPERAAERRNLVLKRMVDLGWIAPGARAGIVNEEVVVAAQRRQRQAPWALDEAVERVEAKLGEGSVAAGTLTLQTTIDSLLQHVAEGAVHDGLNDLSKRSKRAANAEVALVAMDPSDGSVLAMVGGRSYGGSSFNRATKAQRQAGSTVKALSWLALIEADVNASSQTWVPDEPLEREVNGEVWAPQNYDGEFLGEVRLGQALATSRNIPAVHVSEWVGIEPLAAMLGEVGLDRARPYPSAALGAFEATPLELATAYTIFPGHGRVTQPRLVRSVRLPDGTEGWADSVKKSRVVSDRSAFLVHDMLATTMSEGTGRTAAQYGVEGVVGGKTGTTDGGRDAWFVGYTPQLVVAVWVGLDKGDGLGLTGAQAALPIWARLMAGSGRLVNTPAEAPEGVESITLCTETGEVAVESCPEAFDAWFSADAESTTSCTLHDSGVFAGTRSIIENLRQRLTPGSGAGEQDDNPTLEAEPEAKPKRRWGLFGREKR